VVPPFLPAKKKGRRTAPGPDSSVLRISPHSRFLVSKGFRKYSGYPIPRQTATLPGGRNADCTPADPDRPPSHADVFLDALDEGVQIRRLGDEGLSTALQVFPPVSLG